MAEDTPTNSVPAAGTANPAGERAPSAEPKDAPAPTETPSGEETEKSNGSEEKETQSAPEAGKQEQSSETKVEEPNASGEPSDAKEQGETAVTAPADSVAATAPEPSEALAPNGTPASKKAKRKSTGIAESKAKASRRKSQARPTNLHAKPGEYYLAHLRSFPPWPAIICDEDILPKSLSDTRPVSTARADGTIREDYAEGGKRAHERTFPVMFLETNEFAWMPNTDLKPLNPEDCKDVPEKGKSKSLLAAYAIAAENHNLQYFKDLLLEHEKALQLENEEREAKAAAKAEKESRKKKRKSMDVVDDEDVDMEDVDDRGKTPKSSKKRRKSAADTDVESEKPAKTPKTATKLKLTTPKAPVSEETTKKTSGTKAKQGTSTKKGGKAAVSDEGEEDTGAETKEPEKQADPQEEKAKRQKEVLFVRHKLQKGFISRDSPPEEKEMDAMAGLFTRLEAYPDLEVSIIRATRINKVLKMIVKLPFIPRDEEFHFRRRSLNILSKWKSILDADAGAASAAENKGKPTANGVHKEDEKTPETPNKTEAEEEKKESEEKQAKESESPADLDIPMPDAGAEVSGKTPAPEAAEEPSKETKETETAEPAKEAPEAPKAAEASEAPKENKTEEKPAETAA